MSKAMCHLHRVIVTILLLLALASGAGTAFALLYSRSKTGTFAGPSSLTSHWLTQSATWLDRQAGLQPGAILGVSILLAVLALAFLWLELRPFAQARPRLVLSRGGLGEVTVNLDQISRLAQREAEHVSGVREVETSTHTLKNGINVKQKVSVEPEMAYLPLAEQVQRRVKQSLEHHLGFPVASVEVLLQHASLRKSVI